MEIHLAQILFQMVNFGVVFGALTYLMYKPVLKALRQRSQKIADSQQAADELLQEKAEIEKQKTKVVSQARKEANDLMAEARQQAFEKAAPPYRRKYLIHHHNAQRYAYSDFLIFHFPFVEF